MKKSASEFEFCWTPRRRRLWRQCLRKYFYYYYGARGGNLENAPRKIRDLYFAKITLPMIAYLRRAVNLAIREIFYAPLEADAKDDAISMELAETVFKIIQREFRQYLSGNDCPKVICSDWLDESVKPGYLFDDMCDKANQMCAALENGAWGQLKNIEFACRRYVESPLILNIGELKCAITSLVAFRQSADFWLIEAGGTEVDGDEFAALARFAFFNRWQIRPEQIKTFILKSDESGSFVQVGADADFSEVFSEIRKDVDAMLGMIRSDGTLVEEDFPCNTSECENCSFRLICPQKN